MAESHSTGAETRACAGKLCAGTTSRFGRADRTAGYPPRAIDLAGSGRRAKVRGGAEARRGRGENRGRRATTDRGIFMDFPKIY